MKQRKEMVLNVCAAALGESQILDIHRHSRHPGVKRTVCFALWVSPSMTKAAVKSVLRSCVECQSIDLAPVHWRKRKLDVDTNWTPLGMDITHYSGGHFLTLTDCRPSWFAIWWCIQYKNSTIVSCHLEAVFLCVGHTKWAVNWQRHHLYLQKF